MDIKDFRKLIFINSQYCTYYLENKKTVLAGILRNNGYKFQQILPDETLEYINKTSRKFYTILNSVVAAEILMYVYFFIFPYFLKIMKMPFFMAAFSLSAIPLIILYLTYVVINKFYENFLKKNIGDFEKIKFNPNIYNVEPKAFEKYLSTPRKSVYVLALILLIFSFYAFTPSIIKLFNKTEQYNISKSISNIYLKVFPINSTVFAQRGYSKYKLKEYKEAVKDYKLANEYSFSDTFHNDIFASKIGYLEKKQTLSEFDKEIAKAESEREYNFFINQKAIYLQQNNDYKEALENYNKIIDAYNKGKYFGYSVDFVLYNRGIIKSKLGDIEGAKIDIKRAKSMCPKCSFKLELKLIHQP